MIFQAFLSSDFSQKRTLLSDQSGTVFLWHDTFSVVMWLLFCLCMSFPVLLLPSRLAVGKLLPVWAPCVTWSSPHTWLPSLSFWKGTGGCTLTSHPHALLNRILVHTEQNGCWTLKCSPGAVKPYKPGWSVSQALFCHGYIFMYVSIYFLYHPGYAVTAGHFSQPTTTDIVGGAPQDGGIGKVRLFIKQ